MNEEKFLFFMKVFSTCSIMDWFLSDISIEVFKAKVLLNPFCENIMIGQSLEVKLWLLSSVGAVLKSILASAKLIGWWWNVVTNKTKI